MAGKYTTLIIGSGGREHALAWKISQSRYLKKLYIAPGNAGTSTIGENVNISETYFKGIGEFVVHEKVNLVIAGPEAPLVAGIRDYFLSEPSLHDILFVGPSAAGAQLEGSKDYAKAFMHKYGIPTAASKTFTKSEISEAKAYLRNFDTPYVLKADGLAAGKGVIISPTYEEACGELEEMLVNTRFGKASEKVVIEQFLQGIEMSAFVLTDGKSYVVLPEAKDYKRIGDGDAGPNTGGMGCVSPVPFYSDEFRRKVEDHIIRPTIKGIENEGINYTGFIFFGLMNVKGNPYVIEYNCRLGDPETEVILPRIESDLLELLVATANKKLETQAISISSDTAIALMLVSAGYPGNYEKGKLINGLDNTRDVILFHSGTKNDSGTNKVITNGGRVMAITALANSIGSARQKVYENAGKIDFEGLNYRNDIGLDLLKLLKD